MLFSCLAGDIQMIENGLQNSLSYIEVIKPDTIHAAIERWFTSKQEVELEAGPEAERIRCSVPQ